MNLSKSSKIEVQRECLKELVKLSKDPDCSDSIFPIPNSSNLCMIFVTLKF
jgi:hypothetical protein